MQINTLRVQIVHDHHLTMRTRTEMRTVCQMSPLFSLFVSFVLSFVLPSMGSLFPLLPTFARPERHPL